MRKKPIEDTLSTRTAALLDQYKKQLESSKGALKIWRQRERTEKERPTHFTNKQVAVFTSKVNTLSAICRNLKSLLYKDSLLKQKSEHLSSPNGGDKMKMCQ